jgi:uncharacterized Rossmann fold enzyme
MKIPYSLTAAVNIETRHQHMLTALAKGYPRIQASPIDERKTLHIACYGPSLQDTWRELGRPILAVGGATRWLAERGVVPDYHADMDPRPHKVKCIDPPVPGVHYLMASVCHPTTWDVLKDQRVTLWHTISCYQTTMQLVNEHDPGAWVIFGGSTMGLSALHLGGLLGVRHFEVHGMDGSFRDDARHAGSHPGKPQPANITWDAGGTTYRTSQIMANAVAETMNQIHNFSMFAVFHGEGLTQALIREANLDNVCCADETEKAARIRQATAEILVLPNAPPKTKGLPFEVLLRFPPNEWLYDLELQASYAETLRPKARYNTGTISLPAMLVLRALTEVMRPTTVIEIGTFIGSSTLAIEHGLRGGHVYTCDKDNDCLPSTPTRTCHPYVTSTAMLTELAAKGVKADLFFFDGRIQLPDVALILRCSKPSTVYAFDDYIGSEKGVANVARLQPALPNHGLIERAPGADPSVTIAMLASRVPA